MISTSIASALFVVDPLAIRCRVRVTCNHGIVNHWANEAPLYVIIGGNRIGPRAPRMPSIKIAVDAIGSLPGSSAPEDNCEVEAPPDLQGRVPGGPASDLGK